MENTVTQLDAQSWLPLLTGESLLCSLLGQMLYTHPDREWLQALAQGDIFTEAPFAEGQPDVAKGLEALQAWFDAHPADITDEAFTALKVDYARLFIGTTEQMLAYPWESVYVNNKPFLFLENTIDVREWYFRYGLEVVNFQREPEDFIGFEFSFLGHLSRLGVEAIEQGDAEGLAALIEAQHDFLSEHLLRWGFAWANRALEHARTDFYRGLVLLARGALTELAAVYDVAVLQTHDA